MVQVELHPFNDRALNRDSAILSFQKLNGPKFAQGFSKVAVYQGQTPVPTIQKRGEELYPEERRLLRNPGTYL